LGPSHIELGGFCGTDVLELCLNVVAGSPPWALMLDNVMSISFCDAVGIERSPWTTVKELYRDPVQ